MDILKLRQDLDAAKKNQKKAEEIEKKASEDQKEKLKNIKEKINETIQRLSKEIERLEQFKKEMDARIAKDKAEFNVLQGFWFKMVSKQCNDVIPRKASIKDIEALMFTKPNIYELFKRGEVGYDNRGGDPTKSTLRYWLSKIAYDFNDTRSRPFLKCLLSVSSRFTDGLTLLQIALINYFNEDRYGRILNLENFLAYNIQLYWFNKKTEPGDDYNELYGCNAVHIAVMYERFEYIKTLLQKAEKESFPRKAGALSNGKDRVILLFNQDTIQGKTQYTGFNVLDIAYGTIHNEKLIINEGGDIDDQISNIKTTLQMLLLLDNNGCYFSNYKTRQETWTTLVSLLKQWKEPETVVKPKQKKKGGFWNVFATKPALSEKKPALSEKKMKILNEIKTILRIFKANHSEDLNVLISYRQTFQNNRKTSYQEIKPLYLKF